MDSWERFDKELLTDKEVFYSGLNMEDIIDADYRHAKRVYKEFNNKNVGDYHDDLYVQSDTLFLADLFENLEINVLKYMNLILLISLSLSFTKATSFLSVQK